MATPAFVKLSTWRGARQGLIILLAAASVFLFSRGVTIRTAWHPAGDSTTRRYAGSEVCARCHRSVSAMHRLTAHYRTSSLPADSTIRGSFRPGENEFHYSDSLFVRMENRDGRFFQELYAAGEMETAIPFGIVVGSGTKGQTYLYWGDSNALFQMPVSWFAPGQTWSNSPGYPGIPIFDRKVPGRCLECHASYAFQTNPDRKDIQPRFDPSQLITGIDCERCHGPAAEHAAWHSLHPTDSVAHAILLMKQLSREQNLDLCRFCHGGPIQRTRPSFTYLPGERLDRFFDLDAPARSGGIDVHGNQYGLLASSRCFRESDLTCNNCHNSHREERDSVALFAARCQGCHQPGHSPVCRLTGKISARTLINCVDCHMPLLPSKAITMYLPGENHETPAQMRSHRIAVYREAADAVLKKTVAAGDLPNRQQ